MRLIASTHIEDRNPDMGNSWINSKHTGQVLALKEPLTE